MMNGNLINPLPPNDAVQKQKKKIKDLLSSVLLQFKKNHPSASLKNRHFPKLDIA